MTSVVFVHGTGVRQPHYDTTYNLIAERLEVPMVRCYWGDECGARLGYGGRSIPDPAAARGLDEADGIELWALLDIDPYYELRLIASEASVTAELPPDATLPTQMMATAAPTLLSDSAIRDAAAKAGLADVLDEAVLTVYAARPTIEAITSPGAERTELASAIARAVVSEAMGIADNVDAGPRPVFGDDRDELVDRIAVRILPDDRAPSARRAFTRLGKAALNIALEIGATRPVERRRAAITSAITPFAGDIMLYLARGQAFRSYIAAVVAAAADDVILLAHSLGGIACVDLLMTDPPATVKGLITVGSQAPLLHELGALPSLAPHATLSDTFPLPWINVYDNRDLLSFLAEPIFGERVRDICVDSGAPFPRSHSAYFRNDALYTIIRSVIKAVSA